MEITVYVWYFQVGGLVGRGNVGHASLKIVQGNTKKGDQGYDYEYLSWWPKETPSTPFSKMDAERPARYGSKEYRSFRTMVGHSRSNEVDDTDKNREGGPADAKFRFSGDALNRESMLRFIADLVSGAQTVAYMASAQKWDMLYQNCSSTVAHCLRAGLADMFTPWPGYQVWHPTRVAEYCNSLVEGVNQKMPGHAVKVRGLDGSSVALPEQGTASPGLI
jgi:hypothetical protein